MVVLNKGCAAALTGPRCIPYWSLPNISNRTTGPNDGKGYHLIRSRDGLDVLETRAAVAAGTAGQRGLPLDGFALYRRFQQDEQLRCIPVVLFSTRSNDQKSERFAQELGAVRFVANALKPGALNGVIEEALSAEPVPLPVVKLKKPVARVAEVSPNELHKADVIPLSGAAPEPLTTVGAVGASDDAAPVSIDRTLKLPALIASPEAEQLAELQMEQARLKQSLHIAQQQLAGAQTWRELFVASPMAMWITHKPTQKMLAVNPAALRLFGYSQEEFLGLDSPDMLRDQEQVNVTNVFGFRSKDGKSMSLLVNSADLEFEMQSAEVWTAHDVTYRVRGERAMADEVQRVKGQLAALPMPYWVINADKRVRDANAACCQLLGYSREHIIEHGVTDLVYDAQEAAALLELSAGEHLTVSVKQGDGSVRSVEFIAGHSEFGAGQRLYALQAEQAPATLEMAAKPQAASKLPVVLEMLRYAEDADEGTLLQYAMAQLAHVFDSPLALFASLERVTQTLDICAINHAQANRRSNSSIPLLSLRRGVSC
jgi:PAS domain S-box-containing protein